VDDDVQLEVRRVESGRANGGALSATHVRKVFPAYPSAKVAVADVTFGCSVGECLCFLGACSLHRLLFDEGNPLPVSFSSPSLGDLPQPFLLPTGTCYRRSQRCREDYFGVPACCYSAAHGWECIALRSGRGAAQRGGAGLP
jgi:hypothetical protein